MRILNPFYKISFLKINYNWKMKAEFFFLQHLIIAKAIILQNFSKIIPTKSSLIVIISAGKLIVVLPIKYDLY